MGKRTTHRARKHVIHLSAECYPVAKVGGLGDVVGALPKYLQQAGLRNWVVLPWYNKPFVQQHAFDVVYTGSFNQGSRRLAITVFKEQSDVDRKSTRLNSSH